MKKLSKMLALSMALALTLGMTVAAAPSVSTADSNVTNEVLKDQAAKTTAVTSDGATVEIAEVDVTVYDAVDAAGKTDSVVGGNVEVKKILAVVDVQGPAGGAEVTICNPAIEAGKKYVLLHQKADGTWEKIDATKIEAGKITATFKSFSPVAIVEVAAKAGSNNSGAATTAATPAASPKTGETLPVAGIAALICLAGVVVCAKKVKFNR